jgi:ADP-heptose:LPS heptosyltransferase
VVLNPGAGWPNKRWPPQRFSAVARWLRDTLGLHAVVAWGPGDEALARAVVDGAGGAAELSPPTTIPTLASMLRQARLMVAGDTGPAHLAAALGTPVVGLYGPTDPDRNGPWLREDVTVSRFSRCRCRYRRRCRMVGWCLGEATVDDVTAAIRERLGT